MREFAWVIGKSIAYVIGVSAWLLFAFLVYIGWIAGVQTAENLNLGVWETYFMVFRMLIMDIPILILATYTMFFVKKLMHNFIGMLLLAVALPLHVIATAAQAHNDMWDKYWYLVIGLEFFIVVAIIVGLRKLFRGE